MPVQARSSSLQLVSAAVVEADTESWFCGRCTDSTPPKHPLARVCRTCGLGLMLRTDRTSAPSADSPFLIIGQRLTIEAVSLDAERLLAVTELDVVGRPIADVLCGSTADQSFELGTAIYEAIFEGRRPRTLSVRPLNDFGVRMRARISFCRSPAAALVVLESYAAHLHGLASPSR
jgi:hypothetical protein